MTVVQINATCGSGSTGRICAGISDAMNEAGIENYILYSMGHSDRPNAFKMTSDLQVRVEAVKSRLFGDYGFHSDRETASILRKLEEWKPDIVHLHNIHGHDCNLEKLFGYFREKKIKIFWTFHDCWAFTAYCPHFTFAQCAQWKTGCHHCPQRKQFSLLWDRSAYLYQKKRELFRDQDLTIITPSQWLRDLVKESFLGDYPVEVIHNGIDLSVFKPTPSDFRQVQGIPEEKKIVLGVAYLWDQRKGIDAFIQLAKQLEPEKFQIVLVGTDAEVDKMLPASILSIHRTESQRQLAQIYTAADVFVNPTREDNFPTVNLEALACGTPVVTFRTGGSPEAIAETCGTVVDVDDVEALLGEIMRICAHTPYSADACILRAKAFDQSKQFHRYVDEIFRGWK